MSLVQRCGHNLGRLKLLLNSFSNVGFLHSTRDVVYRDAWLRWNFTAEERNDFFCAHFRWGSVFNSNFEHEMLRITLWTWHWIATLIYELCLGVMQASSPLSNTPWITVCLCDLHMLQHRTEDGVFITKTGTNGGKKLHEQLTKYSSWPPNGFKFSRCSNGGTY